MLIEEPSNQQWNDRWPGDYILERIENSDFKGNKAKEELHRRLQTHLLPPDAIINAVKGSNKSLYKIYHDFLHQRAELVIEKMKKLCES